MSSEKHTVVILHGWGLTGKKLKPFVDGLTRHGYRVFAPDLPGFGENQLPKPYVLQNYASFLDTYMQMHTIRMPILIGHSFGGRVALKYADMYPKNVRTLILSGTPGFSSSNPIKIKIARMIAKLGNVLFPGNTTGSLGEHIRSWFYYSVGARDYYRANPVLRQTFKKIVNESLLPYMVNLKTPCLLVWGERDELVPVSVARKMETTIPNARLEVITGSGHGVLYEEPKKKH